MGDLFVNARLAKAITSVSRGDMQGLTVVYDQLGRQIFSLAFSMLNNYADAEDAMQETFLRLARYAGSFDPNGSPRAWIMTITRNAAYAILNDRIPAAAQDVPETAPDGTDVASVCEVNEMLASLPEEDRQIIILKAVNGMKFGEIAQICGTTSEAARKRYKRALEKLKREFN